MTMTSFLSGAFSASNGRFLPISEDAPSPLVRDAQLHLPDGTLVRAYRLQGLRYELAELSDVQQYVGQLAALINNLPPGVHARWIHEVRPDVSSLLQQAASEQDAPEPAARFLAHEHLRMVRDSAEQEKLLTSDLLLVLSMRPLLRERNRGKGEPVTPFAASDLVTPRQVQRYESAVREFDEAIRRFTQTVPLLLQESEPWPHELQQLSNEELRDLLVRQVGAVASNGHNVVTPWRTARGHVQVQERFYATISVRQFPEEYWAGMVVPILALPFESSVCLSMESAQKRSELERQWGQAPAKATDRDRIAFVQAMDPIAKFKAPPKDLAKVAREPAPTDPTSIENPFRIALTLTIGAVDPETLERHCDAALSALHSIGFMGASRTLDGATVAAQLVGTRIFHPPLRAELSASTSQIGALLPAYGRWKGAKRPISLFQDRLGHVVAHDPFPREVASRNRIVCGNSGQGKSFLIATAEILPHLARKDTEAVVLESGGSYTLAAQALGGVVYRPGPDSEHRINPMDLPAGFSDMSEEVQEMELRYKIGQLKNLVLGMTRVQDRNLSLLGENVICASLARVYNTIEEPRFGDLYHALGEYRNEADPESEEAAREIQSCLAKFVHADGGPPGEYARYFDGPTTIDYSARFLVMDFIDVKRDMELFEPLSVVFLTTGMYNRIMRRDRVERLLILDEAWWSMREHADGSPNHFGTMVELFWREGRKLGCAATLIGQNYCDFLDSKVAKAIVCNSTLQYFMQHHRGISANEAAFKAANFNRSTMEAVFSAQTVYGSYSEALVKWGLDWGVVRFTTTPLHYWLCTTDPRDLVERGKYLTTYHEQTGYSPLAVIALLAHIRPKGMSSDEVRPLSKYEEVRYIEEWAGRYDRFARLVEQGHEVPWDLA